MLNIKINLYVALKHNGDINSNDCKFLTIERNEQKCEEYIQKTIKLEKYSHFKNWCQIKNKEENDESWSVYLNMTHALDNYSICKIKYDLNSLCSLLNILFKCDPLGYNINKDEKNY